MNTHRVCRAEIVAEGKFCSITICPDCQLYNLNVGPMSFRMAPDIFNGLCEMFFDHFLKQSAATKKNARSVQKH